ncbi:4-hydroxybenzoate octaprenyltransferase [Candidatus Deianiraea vastatrix]|uniref:4-hydroxybenzoate octaprenyltransferase n=1 Tax=Candidatus Deianiraea vastatrix TaxID=2163644 RepID=A0A5B8XF17_9RICK|nr:4-hydroxybenzoate octaprenyltransferase [Candidatus Deianiraea vastatrix]QED23850.1 4-hydroxybenzoate octaprenyltransferase [Candidatus Deianiraea vastatrix]
MKKSIILFIRNAIEISRLSNPKPILLLFFPCLWGLFLAYAPHISKKAIFIAMVIFLIGSIAARSFGCIVNDIMDRKIDAKVERTKNRPLACGKMKVWQALLVAFLWLQVCLLCFIIFNQTAKLMIFIGFIIALVYPLFKRFFNYPQLILGFGFNIGVLVGYATVYNQISNSSLIFYICGIYWTMFYDTIYAMQDAKCDEKININSTARKYGSMIFGHLLKFIIIITGILIFGGYMSSMSFIYYLFIVPILLTLIKIFKIVIKNEHEDSFNRAFQYNVIVGLLITLQILAGRYFMFI